MIKSVTFSEPDPLLRLPLCESIAREAGFEVIPKADAIVREPEEAKGISDLQSRWCMDSSDLIITEAGVLNAEELDDARAALIADGIFSDESWADRYLGREFKLSESAILIFDVDSLYRTAVRYGWAVEQAVRIAQQAGGAGNCEIVISAPTAVTPLEHFFIGTELKARGVSGFNLQLTWPGRWEPAAEWIGELDELRADLPSHAAIAGSFGFRMSVPHAEQKFSLLPLLAQTLGDSVHLHLEGVGWTEAMRVLARHEPEVLRVLLPVAQERFAFDKPRHEIATTEDDIRNLPDVPDSELERLFVDDFRGRQMLHVTAGSLLGDVELGPSIHSALSRHSRLYTELLQTQLRAHFASWLGAK